MQEELVAGKYMRAPADASLADKGRAKGRKANKKAAAGAASLQGFRKYSSPSGIQVDYILNFITYSLIATHAYPALVLGQISCVLNLGRR